jgi:hypothetical protein
MPLFGFSYKNDSVSEIIGKFECDCIETAITHISIQKQLPESVVLNLFDITQLEYGDEHNISPTSN